MLTVFIQKVKCVIGENVADQCIGLLRKACETSVDKLQVTKYKT
jgi:hypothetical protein